MFLSKRITLIGIAHLFNVYESTPNYTNEEGQMNVADQLTAVSNFVFVFEICRLLSKCYDQALFRVSLKTTEYSCMFFVFFLG